MVLSSPIMSRLTLSTTTAIHAFDADMVASRVERSVCCSWLIIAVSVEGGVDYFIDRAARRDVRTTGCIANANEQLRMARSAEQGGQSRPQLGNLDGLAQE